MFQIRPVFIYISFNVILGKSAVIKYQLLSKVVRINKKLRFDQLAIASSTTTI